jgi:hypothetical protein
MLDRGLTVWFPEHEMNSLALRSNVSDCALRYDHTGLDLSMYTLFGIPSRD